MPKNVRMDEDALMQTLSLLKPLANPSMRNNFHYTVVVNYKQEVVVDREQLTGKLLKYIAELEDDLHL